MDSAANHPAQDVPTFVPGLAEPPCRSRSRCQTRCPVTWPRASAPGSAFGRPSRRTPGHTRTARRPGKAHPAAPVAAPGPAFLAAQCPGSRAPTPHPWPASGPSCAVQDLPGIAAVVGRVAPHALSGCALEWLIRAPYVTLAPDSPQAPIRQGGCGCSSPLCVISPRVVQRAHCRLIGRR